jgi:hypothetical protein
MFAIFITHTSFQLYYCYFPREYLKTVHNSFTSDNIESCVPDTTTSAVFDTLNNTAFAGPVSSDYTAFKTPVSEDISDSAIPISSRLDTPSPVVHPGVTLQSTKLYDFREGTSRGEWLDILVALVEYLRSGESKVMYLNKYLERNMLHMNMEDQERVEREAGLEGELHSATGMQGSLAVGSVGLVDSRGVVEDEKPEGRGLRRSTRKRGVDTGVDTHTAVNHRDDHRKTKLRKMTRKK